MSDHIRFLFQGAKAKSSDFSHKTIIKGNELYIKLKEIQLSFTLLGGYKDKFMSDHIRFSLPGCKSKSCTN